MCVSVDDENTDTSAQLENFTVGAGEMGVGCGAAEEDAEVGDFVEIECGGPGWCGDGDEVGADDVVEEEGWTRVWGDGCDFDVR